MGLKMNSVKIAILMTAIYAEALKILDMKVPSRVKSGEDVTLSCHFDLEDETLYSLSWWKGIHSFYTYSPTGNPHQTIYETRGIKVNKMGSSLRTVVLRNVSLESTGIYKCEVVAEYPLYSRDSALMKMEVVEVPKSPPVIVIWKRQYDIGEYLRANCSTYRTTPVPTVLWYMNGKKINLRKTSTILTREEENSGHLQINDGKHKPEQIINSVFMEIEASHFIRDGRAVLTCVVVIPGLYRSSTEVQLSLPGVLPVEPSQRISEGTSLATEHRSFLILITTVCMLSICGENLNNFFSMA